MGPSPMANIQRKQGDNVIDRVTSFKYLGITLDPNLTFRNHVEYICKKTIGKIKLLSRVCPFLPQKLNVELYKSLGRPHFDYGDIIYGGLNQRDAMTLQKLQNMAVKNILQVPKGTSTETIHNRVNLELYETRRWYHMVTEMFKVNSGMSP